VQIAEEFQLSNARCGLIFATGAVVTLVTLPPFGILAERLGKRVLLTVGLALLLMGLAVFRAAPNYPVLLFASALLGVASSIIEALISPLVADLSPRRTAPPMNLVHACYQGGLVIVAVGAGAHLAVGGAWRAAFWPVMIVSALLALVFAVTPFPPALAPEAAHSVARLLRQPPFWLCAVVIAAAGGVEVGVTNWVASFFQREFDLAGAGARLAVRFGLIDPGPLLGGLGLALFAAPMVVGRWFYGSVAERYGYIRTLLASSLASMVALGGLGWSSTPVASLLWLSVLGLAVSGMWPTVLTYAQSIVPAGPATLFALLAMAGLLGVAGCSWGIGRIADSFGLHRGLTALGIPALVAVVALTLLARAARRHPD